MLSLLSRMSLVTQIILAMILGVIFASISPESTGYVSILGDLFIKALKAVAPILVFVLVIASIANFKVGENSNIKPIMWMYIIGMLLSAFVGVIASTLFPSTLYLDISGQSDLQAPSHLGEILNNLLLSFVSNPITALSEANFIGILAWAVGLGIILRQASDSTKLVITDLSNAVNQVIRLVIRCAPIGIFGLVAVTFANAGVDTLKSYAHLLAVLIGAMLFVAFVVNPAMAFAVMRKNPYPLVFTAYRESGITAFFTRSSAANIPVNLDLCKRLGIAESTYSVAIPLGTAINMSGAAVTITVMTLAAVNTLGIHVDVVTMLILSVVAAISACGASGVAGGSLLLIPVACGLFGISSEVAMQVVAIGMVISILQDSTETALNSATDVIFVAAVDRASQATD